MMEELNEQERWAWIGFLLLCGDSAFEGTIAITETLGYTDGQLASLIDLPLDVLKIAKKKMVVHDKIRVGENNVIEIVNWNKYQSEYSRQKPYRAKLQQKVTDGSPVTSSYKESDTVEGEGEGEVDRDKEKDVHMVSISDFEQIWNLYPNRQGKKNAQRHFFATVKTGEDLVRIRSALDNYLKSGNVLRGFVKNGSTWFNEWQDWITPSDIMMKGQANGTNRSSGEPGSQQARASFRHDPEKASRDAADIAESIRKRREGRSERSGFASKPPGE